jgi:spore germination protein GerM
MINWGRIRENLQNTGLLKTSPVVEKPAEIPEIREDPLVSDLPTEGPADLPLENPAVSSRLDPVQEPPQPNPVETTQTPVPAPAKDPAPATEPPLARQNSPSASVERSLYLIRITQDIELVRVRRTLPASDSPMVDVLKVLLQGPAASEERQGLRTMIPPQTVLQSAMVRGSTAYVSFNEDFMFNTYGNEGIRTQLQQLVWTITEFSNVQDVQILIEGRREDYLGEGIWIGSPLGRNSF